MNAKRIRAAWWSFLRDFIFPIAGLIGLYQLFTGKFSDLAIPIVAGICMALLGLPIWDRDDRQREEDRDDGDDDDPGPSGEGSGGRNGEFSIHIDLPKRRPRGRRK